MSEENLALARKAIDALNRGDFDAMVAFLSPDVVWEALEGVAGIGELYRGRAEVREWIELMMKGAEGGVHAGIEQIADLGDDRVFIGSFSQPAVGAAASRLNTAPGRSSSSRTA
jgi:ketosteroid isomerase-like protein